MITSSNSDRLQGVVLTQKQEWVTPKISLMEAEDTDGNQWNKPHGINEDGGGDMFGPS